MKKSIIALVIVGVVGITALSYVNTKEIPVQPALAGQVTNELAAQPTVAAAPADPKAPEHRTRSRCITYPGVPGGTAWITETFGGGINIFGWQIGGSWSQTGVPYNVVENSHCPAIAIVENDKLVVTKPTTFQVTVPVKATPAPLTTPTKTITPSATTTTTTTVKTR